MNTKNKSSGDESLAVYTGLSLLKTLQAFIALSAAQSSAQTCIHSAILVIDTW